ncbi:MAG: arginine--tRNA ligase [Ruminococcaceae bacterium]|nr:arginine--tRNA ligase [Oscillospiraceae bacterium]
MTIYEQIKQSIRDKVNEALSAAKANGELDFADIPDYVVEEPREKEHGDFAVNAAMLLAKQAKKPPRVIAESIVGHLQTEGSYIASAEVAGAGFVNFRLHPEWITRILSVVEEEGENFGRINIGNGKKVMVEFVSANPTGPMHMGNARGGALGDCLASVLDWAGFDVTREFYINDAGNQIEKFGNSLEARYIQLLKGEDAIAFPEDGYHGDDIRQRAKAYIDAHGDGLLEADREARKAALVAFALEMNIDDLQKDLEKYRIYYDVWFRESVLHENGEARRVVQELLDRGYAYESEGAIWFRATDFGEEKDEVLVRQNGFLTYYAVDIAYHKNKFVDRGFDTVINIWGADHHGHVARLKAALSALGIEPERLEIILMQLVRLVSGGEVVRMSKRTGKSITLKDLLEETSIDAARFFFNMRQANSHFDFDLDLAVEQSNENPVFYVQYAHARICSILRLLSEQGIKVPRAAEVDTSLLSTEQEMALMKKLADLPESVRQAAQLREPSLMTRYAMDLAAAFHGFYAACKVKCEDAALTKARLLLCNAVRITLSNVLSLLSISAPEQM